MHLHPTPFSNDELPAGELFGLALDAIVEGCLITDAERRTIYVNPAFEKLTGFSSSEIYGRTCAFLQGPGTSAVEVARIRQTLEAGKPFRGRLLNYRRDRNTFWNELSITPMSNASGVVTHFVSIQHDVTYEVGLEATLRYGQEFDGLTGLPNRSATRSFLGDAISRARREGTAVAVGVVDLERFRQLNHTYGFAAGDVMLEELAFRVRPVLSEHDLLGRMAADEFALVFTGLPGDPVGAESLLSAKLNRVMEALREPVEVTAGYFMTPSIRFGFATFPFDAREAETLLVVAETKSMSPLAPAS